MWFKGKLSTAGKVAVVIGASQGVGAEITQRLYAQGCSVILVARNKSRLDATIVRIKETIEKTKTDEQVVLDSCTLVAISCDASSYEDCVKLWETIMVERKLDPDYIFNCAGSATAKLFKDLTAKDFSSGIDLNYKTAINVVHAGFKQILLTHPTLNYDEHKQRHVVLFSSVVAYFPFIGYSQYAPMKAALQSLSHVLRQELRPYNFRVSCVYPGNFDSEGFQEEERFKPEITRMIEGLSKPIPPGECAELILNKLDRGYDSITTDYIGWFLSGAALGVHPREWGYIQVVFAFILLHVMPIVNFFIHNDIKNWFKKTQTNPSDEESDIEEIQIRAVDKAQEDGKDKRV